MIGVEPTSLAEIDMDELEKEVIQVYLDFSEIKVPMDDLMQSQIPAMPFKEMKLLHRRLYEAAQIVNPEGIYPDQDMLDTVDFAFSHKFTNPEDEFQGHFEVRDAFLQFMSSIMSDYTQYIIDPSLRPEQMTQSKDWFDIDKFRLVKDAKKPYQFIYQLTNTLHFSNFIEDRCFGKSERDN